jgi:hypothetical protein
VHLLWNNGSDKLPHNAQVSKTQQPYDKRDQSPCKFTLLNLYAISHLQSTILSQPFRGLRGLAMNIGINKFPFKLTFVKVACLCGLRFMYRQMRGLSSSVINAVWA